MLARLRESVRRQAEAGETLVELIITIVIMGVIVVAFGTSIILAITMSAVHRDQASASAFLHNYAETLQTQYQPCTSAADPYATLLAGLPHAGFPSATAVVRTMTVDPSSGSTTFGSCPGADTGLQQVKLELASNNGMVDESLVIVLRSSP